MIRDRDGRGIDERLGSLLGEGSHQLVSRRQSASEAVWSNIPSASGESATYFDRPILKAPVWEIDIPAYYYLGGAAGASMALAAAAQLEGGEEISRFVRRCHWIGIIGSSAGAVLLVHDLGRPERFVNMLRVFRPTSPMNVGAWILAGAAPLAIAAGFFTRQSGQFKWLGETAGYAAGLFGLGLAGYTGVLVGNTAIPAWKEARPCLPVLFLSSAAASTASLLEMFPNGARTSQLILIFGTAARTAELVSARWMEKRTSRVQTAGEPLREGVSGALWKTAAVLTAASLVIPLAGRKSGKLRQCAGVLGTLGAIALRFAVHFAGSASAANPRATFDLQRRK